MTNSTGHILKQIKLNIKFVRKQFYLLNTIVMHKSLKYVKLYFKALENVTKVFKLLSLVLINMTYYGKLKLFNQLISMVHYSMFFILREFA